VYNTELMTLGSTAGYRCAFAAAAWIVAVLFVLGCKVPRRVHEPREYPAIKLESAEIYAVVVDARASAGDPTIRQLALPKDFEPRVSQRLASLASGSGAPLGVIITVAVADEMEIVDARGEMTRVRVRFDLEFKLKDGMVVRRAETESTSDLPRYEATPEEVQFVLDATAMDAFDRYFSDAAVLASLNRELAARSSRP
jgi:hypothetical protein